MTVALALVSPALLFVGPLLVWWLSVRRSAKSSVRDSEQKAYSDLLVASLGYALRFSTLWTTVKARSGLREGVQVALRQRRPVDHIELHNWINLDSAPLLDAWSRSWVYGKPDGILLANRLVDSCLDLMGLLAKIEPTTWRDRGRQLFVGVDTDRLATEREQKVRAVATARGDLATYMRNETGLETARLLASPRAEGGELKLPN